MPKGHINSNRQPGMRFHDLTLIKPAGRKAGRPAWLCRCACGTEKVLSSGDIGRTKSCGCRRKNRLNESFFTRPAVLNSYWAGFLAADGCVQTHNPNVVSIDLAFRDFNHLCRLKEALGWEGDVRTYTRRKATTGHMKVAVLSFSSAQVVSDLEQNFNITPQKSLTLRPPPLQTPDLARAFIAGYIDGDGSLWVSKTGVPTIKILGTKEMLSWIRQWFDLWEPAPHRAASVSHRGGNYPGNQYRYRIRGARATRLAQRLPAGLPVLKRKWIKVSTGP